MRHQSTGHLAVENAYRHPNPSWDATMRHVAMAIAWHVGTDSTCCPSDAYLAEHTGRSLSVVKRAITRLEAAGALRRHTGAWRAGGRDRVIEWLHYPLAPMRLVVDNSRQDEDPRVVGDPSEGAPTTLRRRVAHDP